MTRPISLIVIGALWLSASLQPGILAQKNRPPRGFPILHGTTHVDFISTYEHKTSQSGGRDESKQELDLHYDITEDFRMIDGGPAGSYELAGVPDVVPIAGGSAHVILNSSTSSGDLHETYKADTSGAVEQGGLTFVSSGPGTEEINVLTVRFPQNCQSKGNIGTDTDECGPEDIRELESGSGDEHAFYAEQRIILHHSGDRPANVTAEEDFNSTDWYGGKVVGNQKTAFKIEYTAVKKFEDTPKDGEHYDSYFDHQEKKLTVSISLTPTGKLAFLPDAPSLSVDAEVFGMDLIEPRRIAIPGA